MPTVKKKDVIKVIVLFVIVNIIMPFLLFSGNIRFFSKNDSQVVNYTIDHIDQRHGARSLGYTKYSIFIDENGHEFEKRSTINDYTGRSVPMYTNGNSHARVNLEVTDLGASLYFLPIFELCLIILIIFSIRHMEKDS